MALTAASLLGQELVEGKPDSPVRVLVYEDLQCPDCAAFREMMDSKLLPRFGARVAFVHRDFPLAKHAWARTAAVAARYFGSRDPKLGVEFRRATMAALRTIRENTIREWIGDFARKNGLDPAAAQASLGDPKFQAAVENDFQDGVARGIARTPTVLVNGKPFIETFTFEEISQGIEEALAQTN